MFVRLQKLIICTFIALVLQQSQCRLYNLMVKKLRVDPDNLARNILISNSVF